MANEEVQCRLERKECNPGYDSPPPSPIDIAICQGIVATTEFIAALLQKGKPHVG